MGSRVGRAGVVGGEDGEAHFVVFEVLVAFDEPDVAGAEHGVRCSEEVGAETIEGGEGVVDFREEGGGDGGGFGCLGIVTWDEWGKRLEKKTHD